MFASARRKEGKKEGIVLPDDSKKRLEAGARAIRLMQEWPPRDRREHGCGKAVAPRVCKADVRKTSGRHDRRKESMRFFNVNEGDEEDSRSTEYGVKPVNRPDHAMLRKNDIRPYRDLPSRRGSTGDEPCRTFGSTFGGRRLSRERRAMGPRVPSASSPPVLRDGGLSFSIVYIRTRIILYCEIAG